MLFFFFFFGKGGKAVKIGVFIKAQFILLRRRSSASYLDKLYFFGCIAIDLKLEIASFTCKGVYVCFNIFSWFCVL